MRIIPISIILQQNHNKGIIIQNEMKETQARSRKALVIHSPHSGRAEQLSLALTHLRDANIEIVDVIPIASLDGLPEQGPRWVAQGIDVAIAAGGDGLVGGVITHIAESGLPLGIMPLGTANDVARSLGIPLDLQQAAETLAHGKQIAVDIGIAQPAEQAPHTSRWERVKSLVTPRIPPKKHGRFAHALTLGLNVQFARLATDVATRLRFGRMTYPLVAFDVLRNRQAMEVELRFEKLALPQSSSSSPQATAIIDEELPPLHCRALQTTVINAPIFGGMWQLTIPGASLQDHLLDIVIIEDIDLEKLTQVISSLFNRPEQQAIAESTNHLNEHPLLQAAELTRFPGIHHFRARGVTISTDSDPQDVTLDGEVRGQTPARVSMAAQPLNVFVPA